MFDGPVCKSRLLGRWGEERAQNYSITAPIRKGISEWRRAGVCHTKSAATAQTRLADDLEEGWCLQRNLRQRRALVGDQGSEMSDQLHQTTLSFPAHSV
ncbi:hypothetical protein CDAR_168251 [Caerostris darwini]|uniref:Uncharacterized protein n=1 Tax=Caerostris darwini TaxID=1538125 RepID=A0AAV4T7Q6_9ARAC|nr:hypothetical protein CDAR_168251 [Caerostris darwini]